MTPLPWRWCIDRRASSRKAQVGTHRGAVQVNPPRPTTNARFILLQHEAALKKKNRRAPAGRHRWPLCSPGALLPSRRGDADRHADRQSVQADANACPGSAPDPGQEVGLLPRPSPLLGQPGDCSTLSSRATSLRSAVTEDDRSALRGVSVFNPTDEASGGYTASGSSALGSLWSPLLSLRGTPAARRP